MGSRKARFRVTEDPVDQDPRCSDPPSDEESLEAPDRRVPLDPLRNWISQRNIHKYLNESPQQSFHISGRQNARFPLVWRIHPQSQYVAVFSTLFEHMAESYFRLGRISDEQRELRRVRDGCQIHHVTIINAKESSDLQRFHASRMSLTGGEVLKQFVHDAALSVKFDVYDLGLGRVQLLDRSSFFVVLNWESVSKLRARWGLPPIDIHLTLGFIVGDVHGYPKDSRSIIAQLPFCPR